MSIQKEILNAGRVKPVLVFDTETKLKLLLSTLQTSRRHAEVLSVSDKASRRELVDVIALAELSVLRLMSVEKKR